MYIFLLIIHIFVCLMLILVVLFQAGRGGGMSDMFGGGSPSSLFGTQTNVFLTRATEVCAVVFVITSVSLGVLTTRQSKSLMDRVNLPASAVSPLKTVELPKPLEVPKVPQAPDAVPVIPTAAVANTVAPVVEKAAAIAQTTVTTTTANAVAATAPAEKTR